MTAYPSIMVMVILSTFTKRQLQARVVMTECLQIRRHRRLRCFIQHQSFTAAIRYQEQQPLPIRDLIKSWVKIRLSLGSWESQHTIAVQISE